MEQMLKLGGDVTFGVPDLATVDGPVVSCGSQADPPRRAASLGTPASRRASPRCLAPVGEGTLKLDGSLDRSQRVLAPTCTPNLTAKLFNDLARSGTKASRRSLPAHGRSRRAPSIAIRQSQRRPIYFGLAPMAAGSLRARS